MSKSHFNRHVIIPAAKISALAVGLALASSASAEQFKFDNGVTGSFDTTVSAGISVRTEAPTGTLIGLANGGASRSVNEDDGDRAYGKGKPFSELLKVTHELELKYEGWGLFARGLYFVDFKNRHASNLGPNGRDRIGQDAKMLDTFVTKGFDLFGVPTKIRAGNQVISWGESTFIPNGINVINSVDVSKLRVPGSELKEAFIPTSSLLASFEVTKNASVEAWIQFNHDKTKLDPRGSYWSNNDSASDDADKVFLSFGRRKDLTGQPAGNPIPPTTPGVGALAQAAYGLFDPAASVWAPRAADRNASDSGQWGVAFRYLAPQLNNTEFGMYAMNYHSRIPFFSGVKGTPSSALTGGPALAALGGISLATAVNQTGTATYFVEYPEDIRLYGASFNTQGPWGIALQGEFSYRPNQPLQLSTTELILAALGLPNVITGYQTIPGTVSASLPAGASAAGLVPNGTELTGWRRVKMSQFQMTGTKAIPNFARADQAVIVTEVGYTKYSGLPGNLKFNGPATYLPATLEGSVAGQAGSVQPGGYTTSNSWGYRVAGRLDYTNLIGGATVAPRIAFSHDVSGVSATFNEGTKSVSFGGNIEYKKRLSFDLSYTMFFGGRIFCGTDTVTNPAAQSSLGAQIAGVAALGRAPQGASWCSNTNGIRDRDFYSAAVTYSF